MSCVVYEPNEFEYGLSRVKGTVIADKEGEPFFIADGNLAEKTLIGFPMKDGQNGYNKDLGVGFEHFNLSPIKLGYVNCPKRRDATYLARNPVRYYKQGTNNSVLKSLKFGVHYLSYALYKTMKNKYPTKEAAFEQVVCGERIACAFCRDFAFSLKGSKGDVITLEYRDRRVGTAKLNKEAGAIVATLLPEYDFLKETLEESWNNV